MGRSVRSGGRSGGALSGRLSGRVLAALFAAFVGLAGTTFGAVPARAVEYHEYTVNGYSGGFGTSSSSAVHLQLASIYLSQGSFVDTWMAGHVVYGQSEWSVYWTCNGNVLSGTVHSSGARQIAVASGSAAPGAIGPMASGGYCSLWLDMYGYGDITSTTLRVRHAAEPTAPPPVLPSPPPSSSPSPSPTGTPAPTASLCPIPLPSGQFGPPNMGPCATPAPVELSLDACPNGWSRVATASNGNVGTSVSLDGRYLYVMAVVGSITWAGSSGQELYVKVNGGTAVPLVSFGNDWTGSGTNHVDYLWSWPDGGSDPAWGAVSGAVKIWGSSAAGYIDTGSSGAHTVTAQLNFAYTGYAGSTCLIASDSAPSTGSPDPSASPSATPGPTFCTQPLLPGQYGPPAPSVCPEDEGPYGTLPPGMTPRPGTGQGTVPGIGPLPGIGGNGAPFPGFGSPFNDCQAQYPKPGQQAYWPTTPPAFPGLTLDLGVYAGFIAGWMGAGVAVIVNIGLFVWNGLIDLFVPSTCLGDAFAGLVEGIEGKAPFGWFGEVSDALDGAIADGSSADAVDISTVTVAGYAFSPLDVMGDAVGAVSPFRPVFAAAIWLLVLLALLRLLLSAVGSSPGGGGGSD